MGQVREGLSFSLVTKCISSVCFSSSFIFRSCWLGCTLLSLLKLLQQHVMDFGALACLEGTKVLEVTQNSLG